MSAKLRTPKQKKLWLPLCIALSLCLVAGAVALIVNVLGERKDDWYTTVGNITVSGDNTQLQSFKVERSKNEAVYTDSKNVVFAYNISTTETIAEETLIKHISVSDCGIMSDDDSIEIYKITDGSCVKVKDVVVTEGNVTFAVQELGEYIAVSNVATVDLAKGNVTVYPDKMTGTRQDGKAVTIANGEGKKYRISQSDTNRVSYSITFNNSAEYTFVRTIILDGINSSSSVGIDASGNTVLVKLLLRGVNQIHHIFYATGIHTKQNEESKNNDDSRLTIDSYDSTDKTSGELYIPYKMNSREEELSYVLTEVGTYWALAGIGANSHNNNCTGLTIAGGTIRVLGQNGNGATAIGGGGNGDAQIAITGGNITAICSSTGAAIGGGIGWVYRGGNADVSISGGTVYAENLYYYTRNNISYGGVAIGSGSSMVMHGNQANINITGGTVTAYARYGNGIGSGNSYQGTAAGAAINISGCSIVTTNALGGGTSKENQGGDAEITIKDSNTVVNCVEYSKIQDKWDTSTENILGAFGIGGGNSAGSADGGSAVVRVYGGTLNCKGGNIGGGHATGTGAGGDASIFVSGGTLNCDSIGGGNSVSGTPGAVHSDEQKAGIVVTGGYLYAGTIGGGKNDSGDIGFATADISGGTIQGRFILSNTDTSKKCSFVMSGGKIDNSEMGKDDSLLGGAVYLTDPNGVVSISGGTITGCKAKLGGAVYMTNGTFTLSDKGIIQNCSAENGGGVYLKKGTLTVSGGSVTGNKATNGAGAYLADGTLTVTGSGALTSNTAQENGGGAYVANGKVLMFGGSISQNNAQNGGGLYVSSASADDAASVIIRSGSITDNKATTGNGGGIAVVGSNNAKDQITIGLCENHKLKGSEHTFDSFTYKDRADDQSHNHASCPVLRGNTAAGDGGGIYMGSTQATINIYCLLESQNTAAGSKNGSGVMAVGGTVNIGDAGGKGNVSIGSSMLVEGGTVTVSGNMHNPEFTSTIYVDITGNGGKFIDNRENASDSNLKHYKIQYFENFKGEGTTATGIYSAMQYSERATISASGVLFSHLGWKIIGWNTKEDGSGNTIPIGHEIGSDGKHELWGNTPDTTLVLYAEWSRTTYTVKFNPNANNATVTGTMADQKFEYLKNQALTPNAFKIVGKRFVGWNTKADGSGMAYKGGYDQSDLTSSDSVEITLYAQWVDCTHNSGEHPGTVTYTVSGNTITETCDCGRTATVTLSAFNVYHDGNPHQATLTYSSNSLLAGGVTVTYTKDSAAISGTPTDIGTYTASITVGGVTASVTYKIENPADGTTKEGVATPGQKFGEFTGTDSVSISANGAFTVRFSVWNLNTEQLYTTAPYLTFSNSLPSGTRIIMVENGSYWYTILGDATDKLELSSFVKMGGSEKYSYEKYKTENQSYRFLFDFSAASLTSGTDVSFTYYRSTDPITSTVNVSVIGSGYGLTVSGNTVTVTAPRQSDLRWQFPNLILKLKRASDATKLPGDVSLTVSIGGTTRIYQPNASGEFLVVLDWMTTQEVTLTLSSSVISAVDYDFDVTLAAGTETGSIGAPLVQAGQTVKLTIAADTSPSIKITGGSHLVKLETETLTVTIEMRNIPENYRVTATIMCTNCKNTYTALVQAVTVNNSGQTCSFSLSNVNSHGAGSYCLLITVSNGSSDVLKVPYYFIVD